MDLKAALRSLNLGVSVPLCPVCDTPLEEDWVRDKHNQTHWRGVRANVCPDCGYAEAARDEPLT